MENNRIVIMLSAVCCLVGSAHAQWLNPLLGAFHVGNGSSNDCATFLLADFDGDGLDDLITNTGSDGLRLRINRGNAGFGDVIEVLESRSAIFSFAVADVVGDGSPDLIICDERIGVSTVGRLVLLEGDGSGAFTELPTSLSGAELFEIGDLDGDGDNDIVTHDGSTLLVHLNVPGGFTTTPVAVAPAADLLTLILNDVDRDDDLDIVQAREAIGVAVYRNNGDATFLTAEEYPSLVRSSKMVATGDWNGDDFDDIFVGVGSSLPGGHPGLAVFENDGEGRFDTVVPALNREAYSIYVVDWDHDGLDDVLLSTYGDDIDMRLNEGGAWSAPRLGFKGIGGCYKRAIGDVDGDGRDDIAILGDLGGARTFGEPIWFGLNRSRSWAAPLSTPISLPNGGNDIEFGQFGGDDRPDLVRIDSTTISVAIKDDAGFEAGLDSSVVESGRFFTAGDFDNDGDDDLVAFHSGIELFMWSCNGDGTFASPVALVPSEVDRFFLATPSVMRTGDFNADGIDDLVVAEENEYIHVWLGETGGPVHAGRFSVAADGSARSAFVATGYFDGDEHLDVAALADMSGPVDEVIAVMSGDGAGSLAPGFTSPLFNIPSVSLLVAADLDADTDDDLILVGFWGSVVVLENDGSGGFTEGWWWRWQLADPHDIVATDINGDADPDLITMGSDDILGIALGGPGATMTPPFIYRYGEYQETRDFVVADATTDGLPDIIVSTSADDVYLIENPVRALACDADVAGQNVPEDDPRFGWPDGLVTGVDLYYYVNSWYNKSFVADMTTQGAAEGMPGYGVPDGRVSGADLGYYVNLWLDGCP
jgi:hypothetical protein